MDPTRLKALLRRLLLPIILACLVAPAVPAQALYTDIEYAKVGTHSLKLDIYVPAPAKTPFPLVIWLHGGGWYGGGKGEALVGAAALLLRGFAVAAVDYRLSTLAKYPAQIHDCKAAVRWLRANAAQYNFDPDRFAAFGPSAGGHLAALLGTSHGVARLEGTVGNHLQYSSRVQAVVDFYGPTDFFQLDPAHLKAGSSESVLIGKPIAEILANRLNPAYAAWVDRVNDANPITFIDSGDASFHIVHGTQDTTVIYSQSVILDAALRQAGVPVTFRSIPGGGHTVPQAEIDRAWNDLADLLCPGAAFATRGVGCPGPLGKVPVLAAVPLNWPALGKPFAVEMEPVPAGGIPFLLVGPDLNHWNGVPLPLDLGGLGYPGCSLMSLPMQFLGMATLGATAAYTLTVPNNPVLRGGAFRVQGMVIRPGVPYAGLYFSNLGVGIIG